MRPGAVRPRPASLRKGCVFRPCLTRSPPSAFSLLVGQPPCGRTARFCNLFKLGADNELRFPGEAGRIREACSVGCRLFCWAPLPPAGAGLDKTQGSDPSPGGWAGRAEDTPPGFPSGSQPTQQPRGQRHSQSPRHPLARHLGGAPAPRRGRRRQPASGGGGGGHSSRGKEPPLQFPCRSLPRPVPRRPGPYPAARAPLLAAFPHHRGQSFMLISSRRP